MVSYRYKTVREIFPSIPMRQKALANLDNESDLT